MTDRRSFCLLLLLTATLHAAEVPEPKFDAITLEKVTDYVGEPYFKALLGAAGNAPAAVAKFVTKKIARK